MFIFLIFLVDAAWAMKIGPIPIENQFRNASAVIHGVYKGSSYKKLPNDVIITQFTFKVLNSVGIDDVKIINKNHFPIYSKGGIWHGLVYNSVSRLNFKPGEKVILLLKEVMNGYEILNQGLGKYNIILDKGEMYLSSSEYPEHPKLGKIKVAEFNQLVKKKFGKILLIVEAGNIVANNKPNIVKKSLESSKRKIASGTQIFYSDDSMLLIILFMGILGAIGIKIGQSL